MSNENERVSPDETGAVPGNTDGAETFGAPGEGRVAGAGAVPHGEGDGAVEKKMGSEPASG